MTFRVSLAGIAALIALPLGLSVQMPVSVVGYGGWLLPATVPNWPTRSITEAGPGFVAGVEGFLDVHDRIGFFAGVAHEWRSDAGGNFMNGTFGGTMRHLRAGLTIRPVENRRLQILIGAGRMVVDWDAPPDEQGHFGTSTHNTLIFGGTARIDIGPRAFLQVGAENVYLIWNDAAIEDDPVIDIKNTHLPRLRVGIGIDVRRQQEER